MGKKAIFIAATGQNVGKTTICLGAIAGFKRYFSRVGFIKPVGQQHVRLTTGELVDKDVILFKEYFHLPYTYKNMSPVILDRGFTRRYLDGQVSSQSLLQSIRYGFSVIHEESDFTLIEGTGHTGVGSLVGLSNALVAHELSTQVVILAKGGLGSCFDELALNRALCLQHGVKIIGVILNRVLDDKRDMILDYMTKALKRWDIPLIGAIPYDRFLNTPSMRDFETLFKTTLLSGDQFHYYHFEQMRLAAGSVEAFVALTRPNQLIVTPASREDIIDALLELHLSLPSPLHGLILTSQHAPSLQLVKRLRAAGIPSLYVPLPTFEVMEMIHSFTAKIRQEDTEKVEKAIHLVTHHLDFKSLMQAPD